MYTHTHKGGVLREYWIPGIVETGTGNSAHRGDLEWQVMYASANESSNTNMPLLHAVLVLPLLSFLSLSFRHLHSIVNIPSLSSPHHCSTVFILLSSLSCPLGKTANFDFCKS